MLLLNGNQMLPGHTTIESLKAKTVYLSKINDIPFNSIYLKSKPIKITGKKVYSNLHGDKLTLETFNGVYFIVYIRNCAPLFLF